jgi:hypothetical protein
MNADLLQLAISLAGIAAMVGLCRALFGRAGLRLSDAEAATAALAQEIPGFRAKRTALSRDGEAALVEDALGCVHLVVVRGDGLVTRRLARGVSLSRDGERLALRLKDFTLGKVELDVAGAEAWEARLR